MVKYKPIPASLYTRQYQRDLGNVVGHLKQRSIPPDVNLLELRKTMTVKEIAAKFGCSANCVYEWIRWAKKGLL